MMTKKELLASESDSDSGPETDLKINEAYAAKHKHQHELAERHRLEEKYGKDADADMLSSESDSEEDVTEDEDGDQITPESDAALLRTLALVLRKDKDVYDPSLRIFDRERQALGPAPVEQKHKGKKVTLVDFQRQRLQELVGDDHAAERLADATTVPSKRLGDAPPLAPRTHAQEEEALRRETLAAFHAPDDAEEEDPLFEKRAHQEEGSYRDYLLQALGGDQEAVDAALRKREEEAKKVIVDLPPEEGGEAGQPSKTKQDEAFLMNYILNRGWMEQDVPKRDWDAEAAELESDASFESHADEWENDFNLRFENGDGPAVPTFSRSAAAVNSVRREDNKRKRQREERKARKAAEKEERMHEIERLQHLKRQDILRRLEQLRQVTGNQNIAVEDLDLEGEFDPNSHDQAMEKAFDDTYYEQSEPEGDEALRFDADGKPVWDDDIDIGDILQEEEEYEREHTTGKERRQKAKAEKKRAKESKRNNAGEQDDQGYEDQDERIEMDADFVDGNTAEASEQLSKKERKKLKKKAKKDAEQAAKQGRHTEEGVDVDEMDADQQPHKVMPQTEEDLKNLSSEERKKAISKMMDDYYQTGAEDIIGGMPTRFKYVQVPKGSYGMSPVEILLADDKDLNQVVGVKHLQPYRREIGKSTKPKFLSRKLKDFRQHLSSRYDEGAGLGEAYNSKAVTSEEGEKKKRKGKKQREQEKKRKAEEEDEKPEKKAKH